MTPLSALIDRVESAAILDRAGKAIGNLVRGAVSPGALNDTLSVTRLGHALHPADLVATAVANVHARPDLAASRARIVAAADAERRRVVRDLHDGAQQRLIHAAFVLQQALDRDDMPPAMRSLVEEGLMHARSAIGELRELAHGIHPAILTRNGLAAAVEGLADRAPLPVEIEIPDERYPPPVEATAYFVVAEALTNVAKHAHATRATVMARVEGGSLRVHVHDDGVGDARPDGSGLVGLDDRLAVLGGRLRVESPSYGGTLVAAIIPLSGKPAELPSRTRPG
jgi:signal transduction histidine kinase